MDFSDFEWSKFERPPDSGVPREEGDALVLARRAGGRELLGAVDGRH